MLMINASQQLFFQENIFTQKHVKSYLNQETTASVLMFIEAPMPGIKKARINIRASHCQSKECCLENRHMPLHGLK